MRARVKKHNGQIRRNKPLWQEFFFCVISSRVYRLDFFAKILIFRASKTYTLTLQNQSWSKIGRKREDSKWALPTKIIAIHFCLVGGPGLNHVLMLKWDNSKNPTDSEWCLEPDTPNVQSHVYYCFSLVSIVCLWFHAKKNSGVIILVFLTTKNFSPIQ